MKIFILWLLLFFPLVGFAGGISDIIPIPTITPKPTPTSQPTEIIIDPPVSVPSNTGVVLLIKSILLRPEGVCLVVVYPTQP